MAGAVILSLGSVNADFQVRVERAPAPGETLPARDFVRLGGGKAANVCLIARRLGAGAKLLARVGDDDLCEQALAPLQQAGVDLSGVSNATACPTGVAMIAVPPDGKKGIFLAGNANDSWTDGATRAASRLVEDAPEASVLVVDHEVPGHVVARCVAAAVARGFPVLIDPSPAARVDRGLFRHAAALTPNPSEAEALTGIEVGGPDGAMRAAEKFRQAGAATVHLKLPDGGCLLAREGRYTLIPSVPVAVVDTTGAGDAFAGALAVAMLERMDPVDATCFAAAASHLTVTAYGSQPAYPGRAEVERMAARLRSGVRDLTP